MLKSLPYTLSAFVLAGGLMIGGAAFAGDAGGKLAMSGMNTSVEERDGNEPEARFDTQRNCAEVDVPAVTSDDARADTREPNPRFDAARDCITMEPDSEDWRVTRDNPEPNEPDRSTTN